MSDRLNQLTFLLDENDHLNLPTAIRTKQDLQQFNHFLADLNSQCGGDFLDPTVYEDSGLYDIGLTSATQYPNVAAMTLPADAFATAPDNLYPDLNLTGSVVTDNSKCLYGYSDMYSSVPTIPTQGPIYPMPPSPPEEKIFSQEGLFYPTDHLFINKETEAFIAQQDVSVHIITSEPAKSSPDGKTDETKVIKPIPKPSKGIDLNVRLETNSKPKTLNVRFGKPAFTNLRQGPILTSKSENNNVDVHQHEELDSVDSLSRGISNMGIEDAQSSEKSDKQITRSVNTSDAIQRQKCAELIAILFQKVNQMYKQSDGAEKLSFVKVESKDCYIAAEN